MAETGKRSYTSLKIAEIDQPQLAEEVTWQAKARKTMRRVFSDDKVREYMEARLAAAMQGDRTACAQVDRFLGIGVPVTINVHPAIESPPVALETRNVELLKQEDGDTLTFAQIAGRLEVTDDEVRREVTLQIGRKDRRLYLAGPNEVALEQTA